MYLATCFKKLFRSPMFWLSAAAAAVIFMFSELYRDPQGKTKTVIEMSVRYSKNAMLADTKLCSYNVFITGFHGWLTLFVPVIVSISAISVYIDERISGIWRLTLHRTGRVRYSVSGGLFILLSGGLTLALGSGLFAVFTSIMFPPLSAYPTESANLFIEYTFSRGTSMYGVYQIGGLPLCTVVQLAETFFYGMVCSAAAMLLSAFCENKYVIICTPFFLKYSLDQFSTALFVNATDDPTGFNERLADFAQIIDPDAANSFLNYLSDSCGKIVLLNAGFMSVLFIMFCVIRIRRLKNEA